MTKRSSNTIMCISIGALALMLAGCCCTQNRKPGEPRIVCAPADVTTNNGSDVVLTVKAAGKCPLSFTWFYQTNDFSGMIPVEGHNTNIAGADSPELRICKAGTNDTGVYTCFVTSGQDEDEAEVARTTAYVQVLRRSRALDLAPYYGQIKAGTVGSYCSSVPKNCKAWAAIVACPSTGSYIFVPDGTSTDATATVQAPTNAWISYFLNCPGTVTPKPSCASRGAITFPIPPGTTSVKLFVYLPSAPPAGMSSVAVLCTGLVAQSPCP